MARSHTVAEPSFLCFGVGLITVQISYAQERKAVTSGLKILTDCAGYCAPGTLATADKCVNCQHTQHHSFKTKFSHS